MKEADEQGLDAILEGTVDGSKLYRRLGFENLGSIEYKSIDPKFASRERPDLVFMRRKPRKA